MTLGQFARSRQHRANYLKKRSGYLIVELFTRDLFPVTL